MSREASPTLDPLDSPYRVDIDAYLDDEAMPGDLIVADSALSALSARDWRTFLTDYRRGLDEQAGTVFDGRFVEGATLDEVGGRIGRQRERVRQIESRMQRDITLRALWRGLLVQPTGL